jgi:hypothetical protein
MVEQCEQADIINFNIDFLLVGVAKGGTSSIASMVEKSICLQSPKFKETGFWSSASIWYKNCPKLGWFHKKQISDWDLYRKEFSSNPKLKTFEASPDYFYHSGLVIERLKSLNQKPNIWIILRNPARRAYSHYLHFIRDGVFDDDMNFIDAFHQDKLCENSWSLDIRGAGEYAKDLENYLTSGLNVQVDIFEELFSCDEILFARMNDFFNMEIYTGDIPLENKSGQPRSQYLMRMLTSDNKFKLLIRKFMWPRFRNWIYRKIEFINLKKVPISKEDNKKALEFYEKDIEKVSSLLGRDLKYYWR